MKTLRTQISIWVIALVSILSFTSCDEDWWNGWNGSADVVGQWRVVEVTGWASCPYQQGDYWYLNSNGDFRSWGMGNLNEQGYWSMRGRTMEFCFPPHTNYVSMSAYVSNYDTDYLTLRVTDYDNNTNYTLRMVRYSRYGY